MTAPFGSVTRPLIVAAAGCCAAGVPNANNNKKQTTSSNRLALIFFHPENRITTLEREPARGLTGTELRSLYVDLYVATSDSADTAHYTLTGLDATISQQRGENIRTGRFCH